MATRRWLGEGGEQIFDDGAGELRERWIGVANPGDGGGGVERRGDGGAGERVFHEAAGFCEDEGGADVVRVADEGGVEAELFEYNRAEVGDEAVVAGEEFVELAAGADVLVVEDEGRIADGGGRDAWSGFGFLRGSVECGPEFFLEGGEVGFAVGEEFRDGGEAVFEVLCMRRAGGDFLVFAGEDVECGGVDAARAGAADGGELVGAPLFAGGELGHGGDGDVAECGAGTALRGEAGENPGGAFVVHEAAGAIDGVEDAFPAGARDGCAEGEGEVVAVFDAFHDELDGPGAGPVFFEPGDDGVFAEFIDVVDGVGGGDSGDAGEFGGFAGAGGEEGVADVILQIAEEAAGAGELGRGHGRRENKRTRPGKGDVSVVKYSDSCGLAGGRAGSKLAAACRQAPRHPTTRCIAKRFWLR